MEVSSNRLWCYLRTRPLTLKLYRCNFCRTSTGWKRRRVLGKCGCIQGENAEDVREIINDIYAKSGVWDLEKVQIYPGNFFKKSRFNSQLTSLGIVCSCCQTTTPLNSILPDLSFKYKGRQYFNRYRLLP